MDWTAGTSDSVTISGATYQTRRGIETRDQHVLSAFPGERGGERRISPDRTCLGAWRRKFRWRGGRAGARLFRSHRSPDLNYREVRDTVDFDFIHHLPLTGHDFIWGAGLASAQPLYSNGAHGRFPSAQTDLLRLQRLLAGRYRAGSEPSLATVGTKMEHNSFSGFEVSTQRAAGLDARPEQQTLWARSPAPSVRHPASKRRSSSTLWPSPACRSISA